MHKKYVQKMRIAPKILKCKISAYLFYYATDDMNVS